MDVGQVLSENYLNLISLLFSFLLWLFSAVSLTVNLVFGTAKNRLSIAINRLFHGVVLRHQSLDSVDDFCGNFRLWRRNYNINIARRMDMIRII